MLLLIYYIGKRKWNDKKSFQTSIIYLACFALEVIMMKDFNLYLNNKINQFCIEY